MNYGKGRRKNVSRSLGNSPSRSDPSLELAFQGHSSEGDNLSLYSRGSDLGSIERLNGNNSDRIISTFQEGEDNINVVVRVRPLNQRELKNKDTSVIQFLGNGQIMVGMSDVGINLQQKPKIFSYNVVFEPAATQEDVLQFSGVKRLLEMAVEGFRCTVFCYGQTGSGKTHTLTGPPGLFRRKMAPYSDEHGLIFRAFLFLFQLLQEKPESHFILKASFLEIYNEKVIDLLNPGIKRKPLAVRWSKKARGFFVENLFTVDCEELDDLIAVLEEGLRNRAIGSHNLNEYSSRSHTILTVYITSEQLTEGGVFISRSGKINFVDLAGSEMTKKTQSAGKTLEEANNINKSLMVLGYCIASLSDAKRRNNHIPYRNSQLTKLLADSLAGNGVTLMIACISPAKSNLYESINTLRYAARAKKIKTKPVVMMDPREALILSLKDKLSNLQNENEYLRTALNVHSATVEPIGIDRQVSSAPSKVDLDHIMKLENPQLIELLQLYFGENETLKKENAELYYTREQLLQDQEVVCRENEKLLKKLEDVNRACCRSPIIQTRSALSADNISTLSNNYVSPEYTNIWTNPVPDSQSDTKSIPESIQKELDRRQIGTRTIDQTERLKHTTTRRFSVAKSSHNDATRTGQLKSTDNVTHLPSIPAEWRRESFSRQLSGRQGKLGISRSHEIFGSVIDLNKV